MSIDHRASDIGESDYTPPPEGYRGRRRGVEVGSRGLSTSLVNADRLPPHSIEAEQGVLGCCLLDAKEALLLAMERIGSRDVFYDGLHGMLFGELAGMVNDGVGVDAITLQTRLKDKGRWEAVEERGGLGWLMGLENATPSAVNLDHYLGTVLDKYRLRRMILACMRGVARIYDETDAEVNALLNGIESNVLEAGDDASTSGLKTQLDVVKRTAEKVEHCFHRGKGIIDGIATGFVHLDKMTGGMHNGELVVIGARPSVGKTAMMMNIVKHVVKVQKRRVGIFSLEMQDTALCMRLWCDLAGVNMQQLRTGFALARDMERMASTMTELSKFGIEWDDTAGLDIQTFRARARRMKRMGCELIVLDYLQLLTNPDLEGDARHLEVASISRALCATKKELNIPIVALAQLNRETEKNKNKKPMMSELGESGQIERDADVVGLLYREGKDEDAPPEPGSDPNVEGVNLLVAKQRNGPTGDVYFWFNRAFMRFVDKNDGTGSRDGEAAARERVADPDNGYGGGGKGVNFKKALAEKRAERERKEGFDGSLEGWPPSGGEV